MPSPYVKEFEGSRVTPVGFEQLEAGTLAEIISGVVRTDRQPWRTDFRGSTIDTTENWDVVVNDGSQAITITGGALQIAAGTTIGATTILRSKRKFRIPLRALFSLTLSQRIANQTFYVELTNLAGDVFARWKFDGTTNTTQKIEVQSGTANANLDQSLTSLPATTTATIYEIEAAIDETNFRTRTVNSSASPTTRATRQNPSLLADDDLYFQIRVVNGGTAPASNTNLQVQYVVVQDVNELAVEVVGGRGSSDLSSATPVYLAGSAPTIAAQLRGGTTGGTSNGRIYNATSAVIKASAGTLYGVHLFNTAAATRYVKLYNSTTVPTIGTGTPAITYPISAGGRLDWDNEVGISFSTGISWRATQGVLDNDAVDSVANDIVGNVIYA